MLWVCPCSPMPWAPVLPSRAAGLAVVPALAVGAGGLLEEAVCDAAWPRLAASFLLQMRGNTARSSPFVSVASQNNQVSHQFSVLRKLGNMWVPAVAEGPAQGEKYQVPAALSPAAYHIAQLFLLLPSKALMKLLLEPFYFDPVENLFSQSCLSPAKSVVSEEVFRSS